MPLARTSHAPAALLLPHPGADAAHTHLLLGGQNLTRWQKEGDALGEGYLRSIFQRKPVEGLDEATAWLHQEYNDKLDRIDAKFYARFCLSPFFFFFCRRWHLLAMFTIPRLSVYPPTARPPEAVVFLT